MHLKTKHCLSSENVLRSDIMAFYNNYRFWSIFTSEGGRWSCNEALTARWCCVVLTFCAQFPTVESPHYVLGIICLTLTNWQWHRTAAWKSYPPSSRYTICNLGIAAHHLCERYNTQYQFQSLRSWTSCIPFVNSVQCISLPLTAKQSRNVVWINISLLDSLGLVSFRILRKMYE